METLEIETPTTHEQPGEEPDPQAVLVLEGLRTEMVRAAELNIRQINANKPLAIQLAIPPRH